MTYNCNMVIWHKKQSQNQEDTMQDLSEKIKKIHGSLQHLKTSNQSARRRREESHNDEPYLNFLSRPFFEDFFAKIGASRALRRLQSKTQVLTNHDNFHIRTRRSHADEVVNIACQISEILGLNTDLCMAIALAHDIGHTPFGHNGESFIAKKINKKFHHSIFGVIIAQHIEREGKGLNLTHQVLCGIRDHSRGEDCLRIDKNSSAETNIVTLSDKFAYITSDYNDLKKRTGMPFGTPRLHNLMEQLGETQRIRNRNLIIHLCLESAKEGEISFQKGKIPEIFSEIKNEMYKTYKYFGIYNSKEILDKAYNFLRSVIQGIDPAILLALMTDNDVLMLNQEKVLDISDLSKTSIGEIIPYLKEKNIDISNTDLDW